MQTNKKQIRTIAFDLDDVLCSRAINDSSVDNILKYHSCIPIPEMITICNQCYDKGYKIIIYTARGMTVFNGNSDLIYNKLFELTKQQLNIWGIKYHELIMGKCHYDLLIDDKAINSLEIDSLQQIIEFLK